MRVTFLVDKLSMVPEWPQHIAFPVSYESKMPAYFSPKGYRTKIAYKELNSKSGETNIFVQSVSTEQCNPVESPF